MYALLKLTNMVNMKWIGKLFGTLLFLLIVTNVHAQKKYAPDQYYGREYRLDGDTLRYRVLYPSGYDAGLKFPLFIFLHGEDERGRDNVMQLKTGGQLYKEQTIRDYYPAVVLIPQCPEDDAWVNYNVLSDGEIEIPDNPEETKSFRMLTKLIEHYLKLPYVDKTQVYIVGFSMGAFGALEMAVKNPKLLTAAVSMGGAIQPERIKKLKKFPIRLFHGQDDKVVPITYARDVYYQLKSSGCPADMVEYPGTGHDSWTLALTSSDFMEWIFDKKKK